MAHVDGYSPFQAQSERDLLDMIASFADIALTTATRRRWVAAMAAAEDARDAARREYKSATGEDW